jgi:hypothetical protein
MIEKDGRYWLFTRMRPDIFVKIVVLVVFFGGMFIFGAFFSKIDYKEKLETFWDMTLGVLFLGSLIAILIWSNKTYKISYDQNAVYMGGAEWRWNRLRFVRVESTMRYDEVAELGAGQGQGILPLAYIAFRREGGGFKENGEFEEHFFVSRFQLRDEEVRQFAQFMYTKIPEKFPPELIEFMNG